MDIATLIRDRDATDIVSCEVSTPVHDAIRLLAEKRIGALPVVENGAVVGVFSERDVIYRLAAEGEVCLSRPMGEVMTSPAITVELETNLLEGLALMTRRRIRHLPVVDEGKLVGFISIGDLVKTRLEEIQHEAEAMRDYIQMA